MNILVGLFKIPKKIVLGSWQSVCSKFEFLIAFPSAARAHILGVALPGSPKKQRVSPMYHGSLFSLYLCLQVAGAFQIQGPHEPVVAVLGGEAELPCFLSSQQSAENMQISWSRSLSSQIVHLYKDGSDQPKEVMEEYSGRTKLVRDAISKGIMVLRIFNIQTSDDGQYYCGFQHDSFHSDTLIELKVAALGSAPHFHMEVTKTRETQLECMSEGWFPKPKVQWINSQGEEIPPVSEFQTQDHDGLFHVTTFLLFRDSAKANPTCSIWNPILNQKKEGQVSIADAEPSSSYQVIIGGTVLLSTLILSAVIFIGLHLYKQRQGARKVPVPVTRLSAKRVEEAEKNDSCEHILTSASP
ncbi:butyrophilin-like protein 10 [Ictidomys tridecemlineatus]